MKFFKKNYPWMIVAVLATIPLFIILNMLNIEFSDGVSISIKEGTTGDTKNTLDMLYHISGEFAIRWMTAVLTCTPFFILFGKTNLFVRQAMGIATAVWSFLHFFIFLLVEGFLETFSQYNYIAGFLATVILIPLFFTSNRKSMRILKAKWKSIQNFAYLAIFLSLLHIAILDKNWIIYAVIVGLGFATRIPVIKHKLIALRTK